MCVFVCAAAHTTNKSQCQSLLFWPICTLLNGNVWNHAIVVITEYDYFIYCVRATIMFAINISSASIN